MAETIDLRSQPFRLKQTKISSGTQTVDYVTVVKGEIVDGNIFQPQGLNLKAEIELYSKIPSEKATTLSLTNPDLVSIDEETGEYYALSGKIINGEFIPSIIATPEEQKFSDSLRRSAIESAEVSIKNEGYADRSNLNQNVETSQPTTGVNAVVGTPAEDKPSERGGGSRPIKTFTYNKGIVSSILSYPENMSTKQDKIEFSVWQYNINRRSIDNPNTNISSFGFDQEKKVEDKDYTLVNQKPKVFLPISNKIMDSNGVTWNEDSMNELQRFGVNLSLGIMNPGDEISVEGNPTENPDTVTKLLNGLQFAKGTQFGNMMRTWLAGQAVQANGLLTRATGATINPNLELLFQAPQLRAFQFQFMLIGKSEKESIKIKQIIKFFKQNMAVRTKGIASAELTQTPAFLNSPYVFGIRYLKEQGDHPSINKIKKCALQNFTVDYTPMGSYMTYNDEEGSMFAYSLSMQFKELTPIYDIDYDESHPIGY